MVPRPRPAALLGAAFVGGIALACGTQKAMTSRAAFAAVVAGDGKIYAVGGAEADPFAAGTPAEAVGGTTVERFDPKSRSWAKVAPLTTPRPFLAAAAGPDGKIYAVGGGNPQDASLGLASGEVYDPKTDRWTPLPPMSTARWAPSAATGPDGRIYVLGGANRQGTLSSVEAFDPATGTWSPVTPMYIARYASGAATGPDGRIYAFGGESDTPTSFGAAINVLNQSEAYSPSTSRWQPIHNLPDARIEIAAAAGSDGRLYVLGGQSQSFTTLATVTAYSPATDSWSAVPDLPTARSWLGSTTGPDGLLYALGGASATGQMLSTLETFSPASGQWTSEAP